MVGDVSKEGGLSLKLEYGEVDSVFGAFFQIARLLCAIYVAYCCRLLICLLVYARFFSVRK